MTTTEPEKSSASIKERFNEAFRLMRRRGLFAKQYTVCCMSCSLEWIDGEVAKRSSAYLGAVYYHAQDAEALSRAMRYQNNREIGRPCRDDPDVIERRSQLHIRFTEIEHKQSLHAADIAKIARECLTSAGIKSEWSGDTGSTIVVPLLQDLSDTPSVATSGGDGVSSSHGGPST